MIFNAKIEKIIKVKDNWAAVVLSDIPSELKKEVGGSTISAAGKITNPVCGTVVIIDGKIVDHPRFGKQIKVSSCELDQNDPSSMIRFLSSEFIKGCGPVLAEMIVKKFGKATNDIILKEPERLMEVDKIGKKKSKQIHDSFVDSQYFFSIMEFFHGEITPHKCRLIKKTYGDKFLKVLSEDPYRLILDIRGFGFFTVDKLAIASGISPDNPKRVKAGIIHTLEEMADMNGHCFMLIEELASNVKFLLKSDHIKDEVIAEQIKLLQDDGYVFCKAAGNTIRVYLKDLYTSEMYIASMISSMKNNISPTPYNSAVVDSAIENIECSSDIHFEYLQKEAVHRSLKNHISIITGGPGTGKSTIVNAICKAAERLDMEIYLLAPTGRASRRLAETTGLQSSTIHMFNITSRNSNHNTEPTSDFKKLYVIDETSMVDVYLIKSFMSTVSSNSIVIFVGDIDQLPPIGPGNFFKDLVTSKKIPYTKLNFSHRFSGLIAQNATCVNRCSHHLEQGEDFVIFKSDDKLVRQQQILKQYYMTLEKNGYDYKKVQIIVPMRQRGETCTNVLNEIIRERVNPRKKGDRVFGAKEFRINDRVMQTSNNRNLKVSNGDCGVVKSIDVVEKVMLVEMDVGGIVTYDTDAADDLCIAYAITVHKSQGSEYETVIFSYGTSDYLMLRKKLMYTAMTRAKKKLILIHDPKALHLAVNNIEEDIRNTSLIEFIDYFDSIPK